MSKLMSSGQQYFLLFLMIPSFFFIEYGILILDAYILSIIERQKADTEEMEEDQIRAMQARNSESVKFS
jgi:hypothetical protein